MAVLHAAPLATLTSRRSRGFVPPMALRANSSSTAALATMMARSLCPFARSTSSRTRRRISADSSGLQINAFAPARNAMIRFRFSSVGARKRTGTCGSVRRTSRQRTTPGTSGCQTPITEACQSALSSFRSESYTLLAKVTSNSRSISAIVACAFRLHSTHSIDRFAIVLPA